jgi:hypothetical protein
MDRELMETILSRLPAPCDPMTEKRRAAWCRLIQAVLDFCYCDVDAPPGPVLRIEALPASAEAEPTRPAVRAPSSPLGPPPPPAVSPRYVVPSKTSKPAKGTGKRGVLKELILKALATGGGPMTKREVCAWLEKKHSGDLSHVLNLSSSVYQALKKMELAHEIQDGERDGHTVWYVHA